MFRNLRQVCLTAVLIGVLGMGLAACGDTPTVTPLPQATNTTAPAPTNTTTTDANPTPATTDATATPEGASEDVQEVRLTIKEWMITPANVEVKPGKVKFIVTNAGQLSHNITILSGGTVLGATATFASSESPKTIEIEMTAGTYDMICSLPGHASQGQRGTITVK